MSRLIQIRTGYTSRLLKKNAAIKKPVIDRMNEFFMRTEDDISLVGIKSEEDNVWAWASHIKPSEKKHLQNEYDQDNGFWLFRTTKFNAYDVLVDFVEAFRGYYCGFLDFTSTYGGQLDQDTTLSLKTKGLDVQVFSWNIDCESG